MRNPIRSEADAYYGALGSAVLIGASLALGALTAPAAGVALFVAGVLAVVAWDISTRDPNRRRPLREAANASPAAGDRSRPRVLVVANRTLLEAELQAELRRRARTGASVHIVVPILASRAHYIASDVDRELADARERLGLALDWAHAAGIDATGNVGDPNAALGAIEDELRLHGADEVIISTHPAGRSNWLETGIVDRLRDELDIPVVHVTGEPAAAPGGRPSPAVS